MKKTLVTMLAASALSVIVAAPAAFAANRQGDFNVSPFVGGYVFSDDQGLDNSLVMGLRAGYNFTERIAVEAFFDFTQTQVSTRGSLNVARYGGDLLYHFMPESTFVPYLAAGFGGIKFDDSTNNLNGAFDYGAGAKLFVTDDFALRADVRHIIYSSGQNFSNFEYTIGAYIPFGGVKPVVKPVEPVPAPAPVAKPVEPPLAPAPVVVPVEPPPAPAPVVVPVEPPPAPAPVAKPVEPPPAPAPVVVPPPAPVAIPVPVPVVVPPVSVETAKAAERFCSKPSVIAIQFDNGKSEITGHHEAELKILGNFLKEFPKAKGEISGHTDNVGSKEINSKLSQRRADSIKKYLVDNFGIASERITAKGYGPSKPIADNKTAKGRAQNRRIEASFACE